MEEELTQPEGVPPEEVPMPEEGPPPAEELTPEQPEEQPPPPVPGPDPNRLAAEALVAVAGIFTDEPLTPGDGAAARALPNRWRREISAWLNQDGPAKYKGVRYGDHEETLDRLVRG